MLELPPELVHEIVLYASATKNGNTDFKVVSALYNTGTHFWTLSQSMIEQWFSYLDLDLNDGSNLKMYSGLFKAYPDQILNYCQNQEMRRMQYIVQNQLVIVLLNNGFEVSRESNKIAVRFTPPYCFFCPYGSYAEITQNSVGRYTITDFEVGCSGLVKAPMSTSHTRETLLTALCKIRDSLVGCRCGG